MHDPIATLTARFQQAIAKAFGDSYAQTDPLVRPSQNPQFGDYQANVAMSLAKTVGKKPHDVAKTIIENMAWQDICEKLPGVAGPGFINVTLQPAFISRVADEMAADERLGVARAQHPARVVVDYSGPNVAKEMHVGHLRSTVIGDALARTLDFLGHHVTRQNHMGDWGTQFGMLIQQLLETRIGPSLNTADYDAIQPDQITAMPVPFDEILEFYREAKRRFDIEFDFAQRARERVVKLQAGNPVTLRLWTWFINESKRHFNYVYQQLGVSLTDKDLAPESFYNPFLADVVAELETKGMTAISDGAVCVFLDGFNGEDGKPLPMIIRKSDGGYLYATTDLAAARYRVRDLHASRIVIVTDARQKQHFAMVFAAAAKAGWLDGGAKLEHVPFGTILGEDNKPFKTRSGDTVKLIDLLDEAHERAVKIVTEKDAALPPDEAKAIAHVVGIGAVKYADLSNDRVKDYVFSWNRMLAMDGNTAPYLQYAYARIRSIFRKAGIDPGKFTAPVVAEHPAEKSLVLKLSALPGVVRSVADRLEPHHLCTYLYELAQAFSGFYENCPVLIAPDEATKNSRLVLSDLTARVLKQGLHLLGIETVERM